MREGRGKVVIECAPSPSYGNGQAIYCQAYSAAKFNFNMLVNRGLPDGKYTCSPPRPI